MNEDTNNQLNESIEVSYDTIEKEKYYTIHQVADKLGISTVKVNHYIFKLNRFSKNNPIILDSSKLTDEDIEKLEIFKELKEQDHMSPDDIAKYFKENSNNLINRDTNSLDRELTKMDVTAIATSITSQIEKRIDIMFDIKFEKAIKRLENSNKIVAQIVIDEVNKEKEEIKNELRCVQVGIDNKFNSLEEKMEDKDGKSQKLIDMMTSGDYEIRKKGMFSKLFRK